MHWAPPARQGRQQVVEDVLGDLVERPLLNIYGGIYESNGRAAPYPVTKRGPPVPPANAKAFATKGVNGKALEALPKLALGPAQVERSRAEYQRFLDILGTAAAVCAASDGSRHLGAAVVAPSEFEASHGRAAQQYAQMC